MPRHTALSSMPAPGAPPTKLHRPACCHSLAGARSRLDACSAAVGRQLDPRHAVKVNGQRARRDTLAWREQSERARGSAGGWAGQASKGAAGRGPQGKLSTACRTPGRRWQPRAAVWLVPASSCNQASLPAAAAVTFVGVAAAARVHIHVELPGAAHRRRHLLGAARVGDGGWPVQEEL